MLNGTLVGEDTIASSKPPSPSSPLLDDPQLYILIVSSYYLSSLYSFDFYLFCNFSSVCYHNIIITVIPFSNQAEREELSRKIQTLVVLTTFTLQKFLEAKQHLTYDFILFIAQLCSSGRGWSYPIKKEIFSTLFFFVAVHSYSLTLINWLNLFICCAAVVNYTGKVVIISQFHFSATNKDLSADTT